MSQLTADREPEIQSRPPRTVLVLCTGKLGAIDSRRSHLQSARRRGLTAYSAGSQPKGQPHPAALALLEQKGIDTGFARSKSWDEFAQADTPAMEMVVTVCDSAAPNPVRSGPAIP
jgi:arsenate reductase